jgi:hypothetical protein
MQVLRTLTFWIISTPPVDGELAYIVPIAGASKWFRNKLLHTYQRLYDEWYDNRLCLGWLEELEDWAGDAGWDLCSYITRNRSIFLEPHPACDYIAGFLHPFCKKGRVVARYDSEDEYDDYFRYDPEYGMYERGYNLVIETNCTCYGRCNGNLDFPPDLKTAIIQLQELLSLYGWAWRYDGFNVFIYEPLSTDEWE